MLHWHSLVRLSDAELARIDIAAVNLACAHGLPGADRIDWPATGSKLDKWAASCKKFTDAAMPQFRAGRHPKYSEAQFCVIAMISHLQRDLGVRYHPERRGDEAIFQPEDSFIYGITQGEGGTCGSLPVLYASIGRKLGYPIKLAATKCHLYCQWVGTDGEQFNIEASGCGTCFFDDEHYRTGRYEMSAETVRFCGYLVPKTPREELAGFLSQRGECWI